MLNFSLIRRLKKASDGTHTDNRIVRDSYYGTIYMVFPYTSKK